MEELDDFIDDALDWANDQPTDRLSGWFKCESSEGTYYTPLRSQKCLYYVAGEGTGRPSPNEVKQKLDELDTTDVRWPGLVCKWDYVKQGEITDLPSGIYDYRIASSETPCRLVPVQVFSDKFIDIGGLYQTIKEDVRLFIESKPVYESIGLLKKTGFLLYGVPGDGKTLAVRQICKDFLHLNPIIIFINSRFFSKAFNKALKETLNDRLKIIVVEELTEYTSIRDNMANILEFLDGELSLDNMIVFSTTNFPEKLPESICSRPSRFDKLYEFLDPNLEQRRLLISHYLERESTVEEAQTMEGLSIAAIKEACLLSRLKGLTLKQTSEMLKERKKLCERAFQKQGKFGI